MRPGSYIFLLALFASSPANAKELFGPEAGVTPFGMGRAYSAIADDWLALHYNPAGLGLVKKVDFQLLDIKVASNQDVLDSYSNLSTLGKNAKNGVAGALSSFAGKHVMAVGGINTQLTIPNFALGFSYDVHTDFDMENLSYPVTIMRYTKDLAITAGGAVAMGSKKELRVGASLKFINRTGGIKEITAPQFAGSTDALTDRFTASGSGYGGDFGLQYRLPTNGRTEVTTSFVWHDIGDTTFGGVQQKNPPSPMYQNIVAGLGLRFPIGGGKNRRLERRYGPTRSTNHLSFAFDYSHLNYSWQREHIPKHIHLGATLDLPLLSLQVGLNQTSLTLGTSFDIWLLKVAFATYGEELGSYGGQKTDRRYLLSVGTSLGFNAP